MSDASMAIFTLCLGLMAGGLIGFGLGMVLAKESKQ